MRIDIYTLAKIIDLLLFRNIFIDPALYHLLVRKIYGAWLSFYAVLSLQTFLANLSIQLCVAHIT